MCVCVCVCVVAGYFYKLTVSRSGIVDGDPRARTCAAPTWSLSFSSSARHNHNCLATELEGLSDGQQCWDETFILLILLKYVCA